MVLVSARVAGPRPSNASDEIVLSVSDNRTGLKLPVEAAASGTAITAIALAANQRSPVTEYSPGKLMRGCATGQGRPARRKVASADRQRAFAVGEVFVR